MPNPSEFIPEFAGQRESEIIALILLKHWYIVVAPILKALLIIVLSFALPLWLHLTGWIFSYKFTAVLYYFWLVFWVGYIVYAYLNWYRNRSIFTNERIVNVDQRGLFNRRVSEVELDKVQNITYAVKGVFATMLNFGTIIIHTVGAGELTLTHMADPASIQKEITQLIKTALANQPVTAEELVDFIRTKRS